MYLKRISNSIETESSPKISVFLMPKIHCRAYTSINGNEEEDEGTCRQVLDWCGEGAKTQTPLTQSPGVYYVGKLLTCDVLLRLSFS